MVNVLSVEDITHKQNVSRDMVLIKVKAAPERRSEIFQLCEVFRAHFIDVHPDTMIVEVTGTQDKIDGLVTMLAPFGILEMVQTGTIAMTRGGKGDAAEAVSPGPNLKPIVAA
jgi:acetolactate synthase-1/3 small subunit